MDISFRTRKLEKTFESGAALRRAYGARMAVAIEHRMAVLKAASSVASVPDTPPERRHLLRGDRRGQFAIDLVHPKRLVFRPARPPPPRTDGGGIDLARITAIEIVEVVDYHR